MPENQLYLRFLVEAGEMLGASLDYEETLQAVCALAVRTVADICLLDLTIDGGVIMAAAAHRDPGKEPLLRGAGTFLYDEASAIAHPVHRVIASGESIFVPLVEPEYISGASTSSAHAEFMREMGYRSLIIVPIVAVQGTLGALTLVRTTSQPYNENTLDFAKDLGRRVGTAIGNARSYTQVRSVARSYQEAALPKTFPHVAGVHIDKYYEPASEDLMVGGDWYDIFALPDGRFAISIGDMMGHGIAASIAMSQVRNGIRGALYVEADAVRALETADRFVRASDAREPLGTALVSILDPKHRTLVCASAGHPGPLIWWPDDTLTDAFQGRGLPLGYRDLAPVEPAQIVTLRAGAFLTFFTDGLTEWNRQPDDGERVLRETMRRRDIREAPHPARAIRDAVVHGRHWDDIAILTVRCDNTAG